MKSDTVTIITSTNSDKHAKENAAPGLKNRNIKIAYLPGLY
jgi:hypothetical protein